MSIDTIQVPTFDLPFRLVIVGPPGSGKSIIRQQLLKTIKAKIPDIIPLPIHDPYLLAPPCESNLIGYKVHGEKPCYSSLIGYKVSGEKPQHRLFVNDDSTRKDNWDDFTCACSHILSETDTLKTLLSCIFTVNDLKELPPALLIRMTHVMSLTVGTSNPVPVAHYAPTTREAAKTDRVPHEKIWEDRSFIPLVTLNKKNVYYPHPLKGQPVRAWLQAARHGSKIGYLELD